VTRPCDPRSAIALAASGAAAGLAGVRSAAGALAVLLGWVAFASPDTRHLLRRLLPLASGLGILILFVPFAPREAASAILRGAATSLAVAAAVQSTGGIPLTAAVARAGAPPALVAFLLVLARHATAVRDEARRAFVALSLRGGWDRGAARWRSVATLLAAVLSSAFVHADRTAEALALRGFAGRMPPLARFEPARQAPHLATALALLTLALLELSTWSR
jgi:energy-coupling factor transporter transmembrane protein EcfT